MSYLWQTDLWPNFTYDPSAIDRSIGLIIGKVSELSGLIYGLTKQDQLDIKVNAISSECVHSFAIEGENLDFDSVTHSVMTTIKNLKQTRNSSRHFNETYLLIDARENQENMTLKRLNSWHKHLFNKSVALKDIGKLRTGPMKIISFKKYTEIVHYIAPPPKNLNQEIKTLLNWISADIPKDRDSLIYDTPGRTAVAHLWFESLHPYSDGNGRIGRALADYILTQNEFYRSAPFSISRAIQVDRDKYYNELRQAQSTTKQLNGKIDVTEFVEWFVETMNIGLSFAIEDAKFVHSRNLFFRRNSKLLNDRQKKALQRLFKEGSERLNQGISVRPYQRITGASKPTATRDLQDLSKKEIIIRNETKGRGTTYSINLKNKY